MLQTTSDQTWVKILTKGLITLPKSFRDELNLQDGQLVKLKKIGRSIIIEPKDEVDYELYSDAELATMLSLDKLPPKLASKAARFWKDID